MQRNQSGILALLFCVGCASWLPAPEPCSRSMRSSPARAKCLKVLLPGGGDSAESFAKQGFVADVLATRYSIDMVSPNATMGYYTRGVFPDALWRDVVRRRAPTSARVATTGKHGGLCSESSSSVARSKIAAAEALQRRNPCGRGC